jgi:hypothetical protein
VRPEQSLSLALQLHGTKLPEPDQSDCTAQLVAGRDGGSQKCEEVGDAVRGGRNGYIDRINPTVNA